MQRGGLIAYPTDTVYGLGCDPKNEAAVRRLFEVKQRAANPIPIMCDSVATASKLASLSPVALELAARYWPGALTIVAPLKATLPFQIHQGTGTLGVRVPGSSLCRELVSRCGGMLTGTSANLSGRKSCTTAEEVQQSVGPKVDVILDGGTSANSESTVVRVAGHGIEVLRQGAVRVKEKGVRP